MAIDTSGVDRIEAIVAEAIEILDDAGYGVSRDTIGTTRDTIADFCTQWGAGKIDATIERDHRYWQDVQPNGKGTSRGTLVVIDFGDWRVANFC